MATSFSYRNMNVHFQSPSQKTSANPVTGHGIIKLQKPLHFTRIGVRSSYNESRRENGIVVLASYNESRRENGVDSPRKEEKVYKPFKRSSSGRLYYPSEDYIREQLENSCPPLSESAAKYLREDIQGIPEKERHILFDMLKPEYISRMWEIAGYNHIDCAAIMLPPMESKPESKPSLLECWRGKIDRRIFSMESKPESKPSLREYWRGKIDRFIFDILDLFNDFEMAFFRGTDGHLYGHLDGKIIRGTISNIIKKRSLYFIVKNPSSSAFEFGKGKQQLRELPQTVPKPGKTIMRNANKVSPLDIEDIDAKNPNETSTNVENYNLVFKFVDGKREIHGLPQNSENFPKPVKYPEQFRDLLVYIRSAGPNVLVGQAWREGREHLGEIVLIKKIE